MISRLCEPEHLAIIILVLLAALLVVGSGKGIGTLMGGLIRKFTGKGGDVTVNIERGSENPNTIENESKSPCSFMNPTTEYSYSAEHERSMKNQENIEKLFGAVSGLRTEVRESSERILMALVAGGQIKVADIPPRK